MNIGGIGLSMTMNLSPQGGGSGLNGGGSGLKRGEIDEGRMRPPYSGGGYLSPAENTEKGGKVASFQDGFKKNSCQTCNERKYQDGSNDPSVSFKTPTKVPSYAAAAAVRGHEAEHVSHEQNKAKLENRRIISQSVQIHTGICPECGRIYISGGTTRTVSKNDNNDSENQTDNQINPEQE